MYKVLIVDDEVLVRVGLKSTIHWEGLGFTVVAEASNGEQAFDAFRQYKPDVVLTDIKMPKKDGLWLTKQIKQENPNTKILILTCYNEFEYSREALKSGADDYILKSEAEDDELKKIMLKLKESLDVELSEQERYINLKRQIDTNITTLKVKLLEDMLKSDVALYDSLCLQCLELGFPIQESRFVLISLIRDDAERRTDFTDMEWQNLNNAIINLASSIVEEGKLSYLFKENGREFIFLLSHRNIDLNKVQEIIEAIRSSSMQYFDVPISAAVSRSFGDISEVLAVYSDLTAKAEQLFYIDSSCIVNTSHIPLRDINIFSIKKNFEQQLIHAMDEEDEVKALGVIVQAEEFFRQNNGKVMEVKLFYSNLISNMFERYHHCFTDEDRTKDYTYYHSRIMAVTKMKNVTNLLKEVVEAVIQNIMHYRLNNSNHIIKKAIDYIEKNYQNEISLATLSAYLNLSKPYVCYLFKKETGDNISLYVNKLRIEKAKKLVLESNVKVKEIYSQLGFSDQQYFSKTFKKYTGMTVIQYRDSIINKLKSH